MERPIIRTTGTYQRLGELSYFVPYALPPAQPPFVFSSPIMTLYGEASFALGQLNEMSLRLPDVNRFIKAYAIKEALLSSAIEGIHTTLSDVFGKPVGESKPDKDTQLVLNYTKALETALARMKTNGLPLVSRVILEAHQALMSCGYGEKATPGKFRKQTVRVGDLTPAMATDIPALMADLERYINEPGDLPALIKAGLVHVQFETIHPFLDGNGRMGRLLIVLMLIDNGLLEAPILYPSYYFKKHHLEYYQRLDKVRTAGDFEGWITYYLQAIRDSALDAHRRAKAIEALEINLKQRIATQFKGGKTQGAALAALDHLFTQPITPVSEVSLAIGKAYNTAQSILNQFTYLGIAEEKIVHTRNKLYYFKLYLNLLQQDSF